MNDKDLMKKYKNFLRSVEFSGEATEKTFEQFKEDYLKTKKDS